MDWIPIVDKSLTRAEILPYVKALAWDEWRPEFVVLHNTGQPRLDQWHAPTAPAQRIQNLVHFYRDQQEWHAGPHFFVADDLVWCFTPATVPGVHSPSWNSISLGIEMVGDYDAETFGAEVRDNAVELIAAFSHTLNLAPGGLRFHNEDPETTHRDCPGRNVSKSDMIARVAVRLGTMKGV